MKYITSSVWILSFVSLFTDISSEMLYPVMPIYLKEIGFTVIWIGVLEGCAEAVAGLSKSYFGRWSDVTGKRLPFVRVGYFLSAISKPMMALFTSTGAIFTARSLDRLGKGIRTSARDALLSDEATPETKGRVFGFHRSMDTVGAMLGPLLALLFLYLYPGQYKELFLWAIIPGLLAVLFSLFIKEKKKVPSNKKVSLFSFMSYWKESSEKFRGFIVPMLFFTLFNSSDLFLLLKMKESGMSDYWIIFAYVFYNMIYAMFAYPLGILSDRIGLTKVLSIGLLLFGITYFGFGFTNNYWIYFTLLFAYGLYAAATEGIIKAIISNLVPNTETATAIGFYTGWQSIMALLASSIAGLLWFKFGSTAMFLVSGLVAVVIAFRLLFFNKVKSS